MIESPTPRRLSWLLSLGFDAAGAVPKIILEGPEAGNLVKGCTGNLGALDDLLCGRIRLGSSCIATNASSIASKIIST